MGFAPQAGEKHLASFEIRGPVNRTKFARYKKELRAALRKCAARKWKITETKLVKKKKKKK